LTGLRMDYSSVHLPDLSAHRAAAMSSGREAACTVRRPMTPKDSIWPFLQVDDVCNEQSFCGSTPSDSPSPSRRPASALRGAAESRGHRRNHRVRQRPCPDLLSCFPWWMRYRGRGPGGLAATLGLGRLLSRRGTRRSYFPSGHKSRGSAYCSCAASSSGTSKSAHDSPCVVYHSAEHR
jgi:hypothetical protein